MFFVSLIYVLISMSRAVQESDMQLRFYKYPDKTGPFFNFTLNHSTCDISPKVDVLKNLIVYIHGWELVFKDQELELLNVLIDTQTKDIIIRVEYPYDDSYLRSVRSVMNYGSYLGNFFKCLNNTYRYPLDNIRVIGHSLGAHISGATGKVCNGMLKSIMALDPAGPVFNILPQNRRLNKTDAQTVEAIHTNNFYGTSIPCGKSDFFPNKGTSQPGCNWNPGCSHTAVLSFYTQTIVYQNYTGTRCSNWTQYTSGYCNDGGTAYMGGIAPDPKANGVYYLTT